MLPDKELNNPSAQEIVSHMNGEGEKCLVLKYPARVRNSIVAG